MPEYPDPPAGANVGGQLIRLLRDWDEKHTMKAAILAKMAETEWKFALAEGEEEVAEYHDFDEFVDDTGAVIADAVADMDIDLEDEG